MVSVKSPLVSTSDTHVHVHVSMVWVNRKTCFQNVVFVLYEQVLGNRYITLFERGLYTKFPTTKTSDFLAEKEYLRILSVRDVKLLASQLSIK